MEMKKIVFIMFLFLITIICKSQYVSGHISGYVSFSSTGAFFSMSYYGSYNSSSGGYFEPSKNYHIGRFHLQTFGSGFAPETRRILFEKYLTLDNEELIKVYKNRSLYLKNKELENGTIDIHLFDIKLGGSKNFILESIGNNSKKLCQIEMTIKEDKIKEIDEDKYNQHLFDGFSLNVLGILPNVEIYKFEDYHPIEDINVNGNLIFYNNRLIYTNFIFFHNASEFKLIKVLEKNINRTFYDSPATYSPNFIYETVSQLVTCYETESFSLYIDSEKYKYQSCVSFISKPDIIKLIENFYGLIDDYKTKQAQSLYDKF